MFSIFIIYILYCTESLASTNGSSLMISAFIPASFNSYFLFFCFLQNFLNYISFFVPKAVRIDCLLFCQSFVSMLIIFIFFSDAACKRSILTSLWSCFSYNRIKSRINVLSSASLAISSIRLVSFFGRLPWIFSWNNVFFGYGLGNSNNFSGGNSTKANSFLPGAAGFIK